MLFDGTFSEVGRATRRNLDGLRKQLGVGIDPAVDYTQVMEDMKKAGQREEKKKVEPVKEVPQEVTGLEHLRRVLRDVAGITAEPEQEEGQRARSSPASPHLEKSRSPAVPVRSRPSPAFKALGRQELAQLEANHSWRAPPPGTYRPKEDLCMPTQVSPDFGGRKERTRSRLALQLEEEIAQLRAEKKPYDHLVQPLLSVEKLEHPPEPPRRKAPVPDLGKMLPRPDIIQSAGIRYHDNTFDGNLMDADHFSSQLLRSPSWDFAKLSAAASKTQETYFQPGQYQVNLSAVRPRSEAKIMPFDKQRPRKPLREVVGRVEIVSRLGTGLPDRSLSRSCPLLSTSPRLRVPNIAKYTARPPFWSKAPEYHITDDPQADRAVMRHNLTFDVLEAEKMLRRRTPSPERFDESLDREQHLHRMRSYAEDICLQRAKDYSTRGPVSVEYLSEVDSSPSLRRRVQARGFDRMAGREPEKRYAAPPSRKRDVGTTRFEREVRDGDSRSPVRHMAPIVGSITEKRASRTFEPL